MIRSRIVSVLVSAVVLALVATLTLKAMAGLGSAVVQETRNSLDVAARSLRGEIERRADAVEAQTSRFALDTDLASDLRLLGGAVALVPAGTQPQPRFKARIEFLREQLSSRTTELRSGVAAVNAITVIDPAGVVIATDSLAFQIAERLQPREAGPDEVGEGGLVAATPDAAAAASAAPGAPPIAEARPGTSAPGAAATQSPLGALVHQVLGGAAGRVTWARGKTVVHLAGAPVYAKGRLLGGLLVESTLSDLGRVPGSQAAMVVESAVTYGAAPQGLDLATVKGKMSASFVLRGDARARLPGLGDVPFGPLLAHVNDIGVWGASFEVPGTHNASVLVWSDVTTYFAELASRQWLVILLIAAAWLVHATMLALAGRRIERGLERMADFLGAVLQSKSEERQLSEGRLPRALVRLARLINKTVEQLGTTAGRAPLAAPTSIESVLPAPADEPPPDVSALHFEGITEQAPDEDEAAMLPEEEATPVEGDAEAQGPPARSSEAEAAPAEPPPADAPVPAVAPTSDTEGRGLGDEVPTKTHKLPTALWAAMAGTDDQPSTALAESAPEPGPTDEPPPAPTSPQLSGDIADNPSYRTVFEEFVAARASCGESVSEITYDKFVAKLDQSRAAVMAKHNCSGVTFQVYVKNGKAALKAVPSQ